MQETRSSTAVERDAVERDVLVKAMNDELAIERFQDYCPNGLQVAGTPLVRSIVSGVTASLALIELAVSQRADLVLVHHGYFWRGEDPCVVGMKYQRLRHLLQNDINLVAYHLPLDAHPLLGNNAQLGEHLGFTVIGTLREDGVGVYGECAAPLSGEAMCRRLEFTLGREPIWVPAGTHPIRRVAWCTGGAQSMLSTAARFGVDAYISGEISEQTTHEARELGVHYFAAGHHATERYGVQALGNWCADRFGVRHCFADVSNPA